MNKKILFPSIGTIVILSSLILYFIGSAIGFFQNPFFANTPLGQNKEIQVNAENINKNAPQNTWNTKAEQIPAEQIKQTVEQNLPTFQNISPFTSITIKDAISNKNLYKLDESNAQPAASSIKVLSMIASITQLGPNYTFTTQTKLDKKDNLYLHSNGDIFLKPINTVTEPDTLPAPQTDLQKLAEQTAKKLKKNKVTEINLHVDNTYFGNEHTLNSWKTQKVNESVGQITPIAINRTLTEDEKAFAQNSQEVLTQTFVHHLNNAGIQVKNTVFSKTPKTAKTIAQIESEKLSDIIKFVLKTSDNTATETITRAAAINAKYKPTFKDTTKFVKNTLKKLKINTQNLDLEDTSGLSSNNKVTTYTLTSALQKTFIDTPELFEIYNGLPIGGIDGTLEKRFLEIPGKVIAKTGTLPQTSSLSGIIITNKGRVLNFSVNTTGFTEENLWNIRVATDKLIQDLQKL